MYGRTKICCSSAVQCQAATTVLLLIYKAD